MAQRREVTPYQFSSAGIYGAAGYLAPAVDPLLTALPRGSRVLDVGCGNGYWPGRLAAMGFQVIGIDPSPSGIALARAAHPAVRFEERALSEDLLTDLGEPPFDAVVSFEVVEHLYAPARWAAACFKALKPDGLFVCSAPYHGYLKNLLVALAGRWDQHHSVHNEGGHIKFFSRRALGTLLADAGFERLRFCGAGRVPYLWKSMVFSARRPSQAGP